MTNMPDQPGTSATSAPLDVPNLDDIDRLIAKIEDLSADFRTTAAAHPGLLGETTAALDQIKQDKQAAESASDLAERSADLESNAKREYMAFAMALVGKLVGEFVIPMESGFDNIQFAVTLVADQLAAAMADDKFDAATMLVRLPPAA